MRCHTRKSGSIPTDFSSCFSPQGISRYSRGGIMTWQIPECSKRIVSKCWDGRRGVTGAGARPLRSASAVADEFVDGGQERDDDDAEDHQGEVVLDDRDVAEEIARHGEAADPRQAAQRAEQHE